MKTPEEIKKGLECCLVCRDYRDCLICPYGKPKKRGVLPCECEVKQDTFAYIQQLERERDAAVKALHGDCWECVHRGMREVCYDCVHFSPFTDDWKNDSWQWRGVQEVE